MPVSLFLKAKGKENSIEYRRIAHCRTKVDDFKIRS